MNRNFSSAFDIQPGLITDYQQYAIIYLLIMYIINLVLIVFNQYRISKRKKVFYLNLFSFKISVINLIITNTLLLSKIKDD